MKDINSEYTLQFNPETVQIGNQLWMTENLKYDDGGDGIIYNPENGEYYYTWDAAMRVAKKLGWKLPSVEDWNKTAEECESECVNPDEDDIGYRDYEGGNLKEKLKVKLAGHYYGSFDSVGSYAHFWTSNSYGVYAYYKYFFTDSSIGSNYDDKNYKFSVRLIKDI